MEDSAPDYSYTTFPSSPLPLNDMARTKDMADMVAQNIKTPYDMMVSSNKVLNIEAMIPENAEEENKRP